jgi:hypothetical protein
MALTWGHIAGWAVALGLTACVLPPDRLGPLRPGEADDAGASDARADAEVPARFRVEGRLVLGAQATQSPQFRILGGVALGEVRSFGQQYEVEGRLTLTCPKEASCPQAF